MISVYPYFWNFHIYANQDLWKSGNSKNTEIWKTKIMYYKEIFFLKHSLTGKKWLQVAFEPRSLTFQASAVNIRPLTPLPPSTLELKGCIRARPRP